MWDAWQSTHGAKCVKHTTNDQNMLNMNKYVKTQNLILIGVQESEKKKKHTHTHPKEAFYQKPNVHTLYIYDEQCMNMWKSGLNTC